MKYLAYLLVGLTIGGLSGMLGIGGGVLMVPVLVWFFHHEQRQAQGITLAVLALPVVLPGVWEYYSQELITRKDLITAACIGGAFAVGAYAGATFQTVVPVSVLRLLFGIMLIYIGARFIVHSDSQTAAVAAGLVSAGVAWLAYLGLRFIGRRYLPAPELGPRLQDAHQHGHGHLDYSI